MKYFIFVLAFVSALQTQAMSTNFNCVGVNGETAIVGVDGVNLDLKSTAVDNLSSQPTIDYANLPVAAQPYPWDTIDFGGWIFDQLLNSDGTTYYGMIDTRIGPTSKFYIYFSTTKDIYYPNDGEIKLVLDFTCTPQ